MSSTNSELLLAGYECWNHDDLEGWLELLHPDVVIVTSGLFPDLARDYCGHHGAARFWRQMHEPWEVFRIEVEHVEDEDEHAVASIRFRGRGADSGVEVDMRFGMLMTVRDGLAVELFNRRTFDEARAELRSRPAASRRASSDRAP